VLVSQRHERWQPQSYSTCRTTTRTQSPTARSTAGTALDCSARHLASVYRRSSTRSGRSRTLAEPSYSSSTTQI